MCMYILLGHVGNIRYNNIIHEHRAEYEQADVKEKTKIAMGIVQKVKADGGRFLKMVDGCTWVEVEDGVARDKVSNAFRSKRKAGGDRGNNNIAIKARDAADKRSRVGTGVGGFVSDIDHGYGTFSGESVLEREREKRLRL